MLENFLNAKPLFYDEIDYTRMPRVYNRIKKHFTPAKIIHIVGTNGKGTSGRFLATALYNSGFQTGHYTSPHILHFNERIWHNGEDVCMDRLESTHGKLLEILTEDEVESLSYFEYTTLLAMLYFSNKCDYIVLEAGLGGEHDATAVFSNDLTLVTPIDKDHEAFLGRDISSIAMTKLRAIQKNAILARQHHLEVYNIARSLEMQKDIKVFNMDELLNSDDKKKIEEIAENENLVSYLKDNLSLSIAALHYFNIEYSTESFQDAKLFGRLTRLSKNIIIDVGHNPLAAQSIQKSLKGKKYTLIYNSYKDKEYEKILEILKPIVKRVLLIDIENARIEESKHLQESLDKLKIQWDRFERVEEDEFYLVFGSFSVVEAFLEVYNG